MIMLEACKTRRQFVANAGGAGAIAALLSSAPAFATSVVPSSVDISGGNERALDEFWAPKAQNGRDSVELWAWCRCGSVAINSLGIDSFENGRPNLSRLTVTFPNGRILRDFAFADARAKNSSGVLESATARTENIDPYLKYTASFKGEAIDTSYRGILDGRPDERRVPVELEIEFGGIVPAWTQGSLDNKFDAAAKRLDMRGFPGGRRTEQLMRVKGHIIVDGVRVDFDGGGMRAHRQNLDALIKGAYVWQAACFPSGRAFSVITAVENGGGAPAFAEGAAFMGEGKLIAARAITVPWIREWNFNRDDVGFSLQQAGRDEADVIQGQVVLSAPVLAKGPYAARRQAVALYRWNGEETYGLIEQSFG